MAREVISNKLKFDYGVDGDGKSNGTWTFSKVRTGLTSEHYYNLARGLNMLQVNNDATFYRIAEYVLTK